MPEQSKKDEGPGIVEVMAQEKVSPADYEKARSREKNILTKIKALNVAIIGLSLGAGGFIGEIIGEEVAVNFVNRQLRETSPFYNYDRFFVKPLHEFRDIGAGVALFAGAVITSRIANRIMANSLRDGLIRPEKL